MGGRWWGAFCESAEKGADRSEIGPYQESWVGKVDGSGIGMTWARADGTRRVVYRGGVDHLHGVGIRGYCSSAAMNTATSPFFRRLLTISTALAFGGMLGSLGVAGRDANGMRFSFHWSVPLLFLVGAGAAVWFWQLIFRFDSGGDAHLRGRLKLVAGSLLLVALGCFLFPLRLVSPDKRMEVIFGMGFAFVVLSGMGWLIYQTIRWVEAASRAEEERSNER